MPVASRSFAAMAERTPSALSVNARHSSSSASNPVAITPPSRKKVRGLSARADSNIAKIAGGAAKVRPMDSSRITLSPYNCNPVVNVPSTLKVERREAKSLGLAVCSPIRATTRSISPHHCSASSQDVSGHVINASTASKRWRASIWLFSGKQIQRFNNRLPDAVEQSSRTPHKVLATPP